MGLTCDAAFLLHFLDSHATQIQKSSLLGFLFTEVPYNFRCYLTLSPGSLAEPTAHCLFQTTFLPNSRSEGDGSAPKRAPR